MDDKLHEIQPAAPADATVCAPPSKAATLRATVMAALADGKTTITNALFSDDTIILAEALKELGFEIETERDSGRITVAGCGGDLPASEAKIYAGDSGATLRFLLPVLALGGGRYTVTGSKRLGERPIGELVDALRSMDVHINARGRRLPVIIEGGKPQRGGRVQIDSSRTSQFTSALLMAGPYYEGGLEIELIGDPVSMPYVNLTVGMMREFGVNVDRRGNVFHVPEGVYTAREYEVEPDATSASYLFATAAMTGGSVTIRDVPADSNQGDWVFADLLGRMGCTVERDNGNLRVRAGRMRGIEIDMRDHPDIVPTLAAVATCARGWTRIRNIGHIRCKESDRIAVLARELAALGVSVEAGPESLAIKGSIPSGGEVNPEGDHRMAMAMSLIGLRTPGVRVRGPECVTKSFPEFFKALERAARPSGGNGK